VRAGALVVPLLSAASLMDVEAIIYQELSLLPSLSVSENIFFVRESHRHPVGWQPAEGAAVALALSQAPRDDPRQADPVASISAPRPKSTASWAGLPRTVSLYW